MNQETKKTDEYHDLGVAMAKDGKNYTDNTRKIASGRAVISKLFGYKALQLMEHKFGRWTKILLDG